MKVYDKEGKLLSIVGSDPVRGVTRAEALSRVKDAVYCEGDANIPNYIPSGMRKSEESMAAMKSNADSIMQVAAPAPAPEAKPQKEPREMKER